MDEVFGVVDDGSPRAALDIAGQAVRAFNHRAACCFDDPDQDQSGWRYVPDVYRCLGELTYLTHGLYEVIGRMSSSMQTQLDAGDVGADAGSLFEGRPADAIAVALAALGDAEEAVSGLYEAFEAAQGTLAGIHYAGADVAAETQ